MAVFVPDTIEGASYERQGATERFRRTGIIFDIDAAGSSDPTVLYKALDVLGFPGLASNYPGTEVPLSKVRVTPVSTDAVRVELDYESGGLTPTAYIITSDSRDDFRATNFVPGLRIPLLVPGFTDGSGNKKIQDDVATIVLPFTYRILNVFRIQLGSLQNDPGGSASDANYHNYVNIFPWQGLDVGYWRITRYQTRDSRYQGYYSVSISAESKVVEDWSEIQLLRNNLTGQYAKVELSVISAVNGLGYAWGTISANDGDGIARYGPFPMVSFNTIFGF